IETEFLDRDLAYIHEAPDQLSMLHAISKAAYRVRCVDTALSTVREAVRAALTAPAGPVSVEIPIDIQAAEIEWPADLAAPHITVPTHDDARVAELADKLAAAHRPMLWLGGGARGAEAAVKRLVDMGFGVVTSVQGRGIVPEDHAATLGAFNIHPTVETFYKSCDAVLVVGSRLRGNETLKYKLALPRPLYRVDADGLADGRGYRNDLFIQGDAARVLNALADRLQGRLSIDPAFHADLAAAREVAVKQVAEGLGPYRQLVSALQSALGRDFNLLKLFSPRAGVHALGGGIGQGMQMGIGAALAGNAKKTVALCGDGGLMVNVGELATAVQEKAPVVILLMNDQCYGVIRNIQDAQYGGRRHYVQLHQPDFAAFCASLQLKHERITAIDQAEAAVARAVAHDGPVLLEVDMLSVGSFASHFAGPPVREPANA
ncbi:MAG: thiamine pyrophosphate-binding protein, partial [Pandoraea sp.]|nr:thiamine pyrophosphate-binding protein [Pandoraea sp.]